MVKPYRVITMRTLAIRASLLTLLAASTAAAQRDTAFTWSRRLPDGARFSIRNLNGPVDVRAGTTDRIEVRATIRVESRGIASDVTFEVRDLAADDVEICTVYKGVSACEPDNSWSDVRVSVRYVVDLPKGLRFRGHTGNGDVIVMQTVAEIDISTGNGDVVIRESLSRASATTGNGDVTVAAANGPVKVSTGNGRITVNTSRGPVDASTGNGDIDATMTTVPQGSDLPSMSLTSGHGSVRVTLPPTFNGEIDANTGHGSINTDFEIRLQGRLDGSRLRGTIGNGNGPVIKIRSGNGRLEIRKG
jgi:hypothetical protein